MVLLSRSDRCGRCYSVIRARAVMRCLVRGWRCHGGRHARSTQGVRRVQLIVLFDRYLTGHVNRRTNQMLACQPCLRIRNNDVKATIAAIVSALEWRLLDLQHRENMVDD